MKKYFILAAAALLALAACSKVSRVAEQDHAITFQVVSHALKTKANTALPTNVTFGTFGYWTATDWATDGDANLYFDNLPVSNANGVWGFNPTQYWPKTGMLSFASYAPYTENGGEKGFDDAPAYSKADGFTFADYTIVDDANIDLLYADDANNKDCTSAKNADGTAVISGADVNNFKGVPTLFVHALSQLKFEFKQKLYQNSNNEVEEANSFITVTKVELVDLYNTSTFTDKNWESTPETSEEVPVVAGKASYTVFADETGTTINKENAAEATPLGDPKIVLPQILKGDAVGPQILRVSYTITTKYASNPEAQTSPTIISDVNLGDGTLSKWLQSQSITYVVTLSPYSDVPITFDPAVAAWTEVPGEIAIEK